MPKRLRYLPELDGLRGVAVLAVMAFHTSGALSGGFLGVDVFFVLSGFLITALLVVEFDRFRSVILRHFYARRALRLGPALGLLLITHVVIGTWILDGPEAARTLAGVLLSLFYVMNWALAFAFHDNLYLGHTWSLSIEEQFYLAWPVLLVLLLRVISSRRTLVGLVLAAAAASAGWRLYLLTVGATTERLYFGLDTRLDGLMFGSALGLAWASGMLSGFVGEGTGRVSARQLARVSKLAAFALLVYFFIAYWLARWIYQFGFVVVEILVVVLILDVVSHDGSWLRRWLSVRWLVWVGRISYGVYLWHFPVFEWVESPPLAWLTTFLIASSSFYLVERPILRCKARFSR